MSREDELRAQVERQPTIPIDEFRRRSRRSFVIGGAGVLGTGALWRWVQTQQRSDGIPSVLRRGLRINESFWHTVAGTRSAPEYELSRASPIRVNGRIGLGEPIDLDAWTTRVEGPDGELLDELDIAAFAAMPQRDLVIDHKCIEGWSHIVHWGGVRFRDFYDRYADRVDAAHYVAVETPDREYYVGWDMESILHPQTLLVLRHHGEPLDELHGAPLRLATPNKYGIKCLKRIGVIRFSRERPADYWAERSYDYDAGL
jgi:hypothetical protein